jgi:hypothetical protein
MARRSQRFRVGTYRTGGYSLGTLTVGADQLSLDSWPVVRRLVTHERTEVRMVRGRLAPPFWRWGLVLASREVRYGVALGPGQASRIRDALLSAGFTVHDESSWLRFTNL